MSGRMEIIVDVWICMCVNVRAYIARGQLCPLQISVSEIARHGQELFREQNGLVFLFLNLESVCFCYARTS